MALLGLPRFYSGKPVERAPFGVCNRKHDNAVRMRFECHDVGKAMHHGAAYGRWPSDDARPHSEGPRSRCDPGESIIDLGHEILPQPNRPLVIPQRRGPDF